MVGGIPDFWPLTQWEEDIGNRFYWWWSGANMEMVEKIIEDQLMALDTLSNSSSCGTFVDYVGDTLSQVTDSPNGINTAVMGHFRFPQGAPFNKHGSPRLRQIFLEWEPELL
jgi:hypothetical protein